MSALALVGKIPFERDFVRHNLTDPAAIAFDRWLQESHQALVLSSSSLTHHTVRFVFSDVGSQKVVFGVMANSHDMVGRTYPLSIFAVLPASSLADVYPALHVSQDAYLASAAELLGSAEQLSLNAMIERLSFIPAPTQSALDMGRTLREQTLRDSFVASMHQRLFGDGVTDGPSYAYQTFLTACESVREGPPSRPTTVLDCPIVIDVDMFTWLELARRVLRWNMPPTFFWLEEPSPRLLIALGSPPPQILSYIARPDADSERLWPLTTTHPTALERAQRDFGEVLRPFGHGSEARLEQLVSAIALRAGAMVR